MKGMKKIWSSVTHKYLVLKQPLAQTCLKNTQASRARS